MSAYSPKRPTAGRAFFKAHGHGNDYLVFEPGEDWVAESGAVRRICDPHRGVGADGVVTVSRGDSGPVSLRMFNPDGGEFERSGNGLRVAGVALLRWGLVDGPSFPVEIGGGHVHLNVHEGEGQTWDAEAELGVATVGADAVELRDGVLDASGTIHHPHVGRLEVVPVSVGNPHLVVFTDDISDAVLEAVGPFLATHDGLANGSNVQLVRSTTDRIRIRIWERGVGRTSASGTSASAVAVACVHTGRRPPGRHTIEMDGGTFEISVDEECSVTLRGPIEEVAEGRLTDRFLARAGTT